MAGKEWSVEEIAYLIENHKDKSCKEISIGLNRSVRSVQHKFNQLGLKHKRAQVGDVVNGWEIVSTFIKDAGSQKITYANIRSILEDKTEREERLTKLTLGQIGWPDRRRPDVIEKNTTHGCSNTRLYRIWNGMKGRCSHTKQLSYKDYGGRGIKVCEEWMKFENFKEWAEKTGYSEELTLDRINVDDNYCPENCKWSDWIEQSNNKRNSIKMNITAFGETKAIYEWSRDERCIVGQSTLYYRISAGWNPEEAITKPSERNKKLPLKEWFKQNHPELLDEYNSM